MAEALGDLLRIAQTATVQAVTIVVIEKGAEMHPFLLELVKEDASL